MQAIEQAGRLVFHLTGDVGGVKAPQSQHLVATTMEHDFGGPGPVPSFLYLVGDVVYFYGETSQYYSQFYEPYVDYPAPIFAVPGNTTATSSTPRWPRWPRLWPTSAHPTHTPPPSPETPAATP
jgi:hypothetical protein